MKKHTSIFILSALCIALGSCSEDKMDEINENKNNPTEMASKFILTDVMTSTAFDLVGSDLAFYASMYVEHNVGIFNQYYQAELRNNQPTQSSTYGNQWAMIYTDLAHLKDCLQKCQPGGTEAENFHGLGIAQVMTAYDLALLTDLFGDVPWTEALQPGVIYTPKIDSQESIYKEIFKYLDDAIENLGKDCSYAMGNQDLYYSGNVELWTKFAYGLKARYTMRLLKRSADQNADLNKVIEYANKSFASADEEAKFKYYDGVAATSPYYQFYLDRNYFGSSLSLHTLLDAKADPRIDIYFKENKNETFELAENGKPKQQQDFYGISGISTATAPTFLLSYHELEFLKAEAYARLGKITEAQTACVSGITAACKKKNVNVDDAAIADYATKIKNAMNGSNALKEVQIQKYLAFYEEEAIEAYNDIRRWRALGENPITLAHPQPDKFPVRFAYGDGDVTANPNVYEAYESIDVFKDNVWWAGGSR